MMKKEKKKFTRYTSFALVFEYVMVSKGMHIFRLHKYNKIS